MNPRFVAWPLELGLGTHNPRFFAWPLELGLGTHNPRFFAWPLELGLGTHNPHFDFEVGGHDGAYKGWIHVIVPFIGRKNGTLTARQQCYNDVHGWYRARIEQLFARLWHWGLVRNIWRGSPNELHQSVRILLHFTQFCIQRQVHHPPYGPWEHVPPHVWGMPCTQCAHTAKFWMSANTRTLVLAPFHKFLVPYQGFFGFPSIWDVAYLNCQPFPPRRGPSTKCTQLTRPGSRRRHCRHCSEPRIRRGGSIRPAEYSSGQIVRAPKPWSTSR